MHLLIELAVCVPTCMLACTLLDWWRHSKKQRRIRDELRRRCIAEERVRWGGFNEHGRS